MIEIQRTDATLSEMPPLTWRWWKNDDSEPGQGLVVMTDSCPEAHHAYLNMQPEPWDIADDGTVTPSVHYLDCGFHEMVKLVGWVAEEASQ